MRVSYRLQVQHLFQLHVDPVFGEAFQRDPQEAAPGLSAVERQELLRLPQARLLPGPEEATGARAAPSPDSAFMRVGVRSRCQIAMPRTYALLEELAKRGEVSLEADLERKFWLWSRPCPPGYDRDRFVPNPGVHWTETARLLQMVNRVFWQFYGYAVSVAASPASAPRYLPALASFEFDTLASRANLYRRFRLPGPTPLTLEPGRPVRLSRYAALTRYAYAVQDPEPALRPTGVVFLYNGERLRVFPVDDEASEILVGLGRGQVVDRLSAKVRGVLEAFASLGILEAA
jgi:hypothetical protein